jgi:hypothetical protein
VAAGTISGYAGVELTAYSLKCCSKPTSEPYGNIGHKGDQCPSKHVRLRLVDPGGMVISPEATGKESFPIETADDIGKKKNPPNWPKRQVAAEVGDWTGTLLVPLPLKAGFYTVQASCNQAFLKPPFTGEGDYTFPRVEVRDGTVKILAFTGFTAWPWTFLGAALLTVGAVLLGAGRRRGARGRHAVGIGPAA